MYVLKDTLKEGLINSNLMNTFKATFDGLRFLSKNNKINSIRGQHEIKFFTLVGFRARLKIMSPSG